MEANIIKFAFLLAYLTLLVGVSSEIPFTTSLFRSMIVMVVFSIVGLALRWWMLKTVTSVKPQEFDDYGDEDFYDDSSEEYGSMEDESSEDSNESVMEQIRQAALGTTTAIGNRATSGLILHRL